MKPRTGTLSVLIGAHQFLIHPLFVFIAWWTLYGFPADPRLWLAFLVHDLGYWGKPELDNADGETHPELGARVMHLFGDTWRDLTLHHSRFYASRAGRAPSPLCAADKLAFALEPWWLYLPRVILSGEIHEYMQRAAAPDSKYDGTRPDLRDGTFWQRARRWHAWAATHSRSYALSHAPHPTPTGGLHA